MLYESANVQAFLRPEGYLELIVAEHRSLPWEDCLGIGAGLRKNDKSEVRVLISRVHRYGPPADYLLHDFSMGVDLKILRVAYHAPLPTTQTLSHLIGDTALKDGPHQVFADREAALNWLLEA